MRKLTKAQFARLDQWMQANARAYDLAKWNHLFHGGSKEAIVAEMLKYQNPDGGMGSGFEADILCPQSTAISSAEAIFQAYEYQLDCTAPWFKHLLDYFEQSVQDIPKYWDDAPIEAFDYPHAPWWHYEPNTVFNPNPCGVVASALIRYGTPSQQALGLRIAEDCLKLLLSNDFCGDHDTLNLQALVEQLTAIRSPLITGDVITALRRRILENTCFDPAQYGTYVFTPLDYVTSPDSPWHGDVATALPRPLITGSMPWTLIPFGSPTFPGEPAAPQPCRSPKTGRATSPQSGQRSSNNLASLKTDHAKAPCAC